MGAALKQISLFSLFSLAHVFVPKFDLLKYDGVSPPLPIFFLVSRSVRPFMEKQTCNLNCNESEFRMARAV
jgi:hypothetical protein